MRADTDQERHIKHQNYCVAWVLVSDGFGLSVSVTAAFLRFLHRSISKVYTEWCRNNRTPREKKYLVDERGKSRMVKLF